MRNQGGAAFESAPPLLCAALFMERGIGKAMPGYIVYWPQDRVKALEKAGDTGPIRVVFGSIHARMPSIASVKEGDIVYPVALMEKKLWALARLPVETRERAIDYCLRELGRPCGALEEEGKTYPDFDYNDGWTPSLPHLKHQVPFNCCSQWAGWGTKGSIILPRPLPADCLPSLRFGYPKSKEKGLKFDQNGNVLSSCLAVTRRLSPESQAVFESLFEGEIE